MVDINSSTKMECAMPILEKKAHFDVMIMVIAYFKSMCYFQKSELERKIQYKTKIILKYNQMKHFNPINLTRVLALFAAISLVTVFTSCKRAAEKTSEKIIEKSIGDKVKVDLDDEKIVIETEEGTFTADATLQSWPKEIPNEVPEFKNGKIVMVNTQNMEEGKNWVIIFEDVSPNEAAKYKENLESNGFKINFTTTAGTGTHFAAEKGEITVILMGDEGGASISVGVKE